MNIYKMQRLEVRGAVRPIYGSLGVKRLKIVFKRRNCRSARYASATHTVSSDTGVFKGRSILNNDLTDVEIFTKQT